MSSCELESSPVPCEGDNGDTASYVSELPARPSPDSKCIVPSVGHCHWVTEPQTHGIGTPGSQDRTRRRPALPER